MSDVVIAGNGILAMTIAREVLVQDSSCARITRDEVYIADEAFFTGTAAEVTPIRELDNRTIGAGKRGPVTEKLQSMYFDQVKGRRPQFPEWLTPVN